MLLTVSLTVVLALACLAWMVFAAAALRTRATVPRLADLELPGPARWPKLSVIVPARNEADALGACCRALLASDYPELEILLVDDRSDDGTGALADRLAAEDGRVRVLHLGKLPGGWLGKNRALSVAAGQASGEWLLFVDADSHLAPGALRQAMRWALANAFDHVTLLPDRRENGFLAEAAGAVSLRVAALALRPWSVSDPDSDAFCGCGAFDLVRAEVLQHEDGLDGLRLDVADDLALGRLVKVAGGRTGVAFGSGLVSVGGHATLASLAVAQEKRLYPLLACSLPRTLAATAALLLLELAPWICLLPFGIPTLRLLGVLATACLLAIAGGTALLARRPLAPALAAPLGTLLYASVLLRAGVLGALLGGIRWKDAFHPADMLRRGATVTFPWWSLRRPLASLSALLVPSRPQVAG